MLPDFIFFGFLGSFLTMQKEMLDEFVTAKDHVPAALEFMKAKSYLHSKKRARDYALLSDFSAVASVGPGASFEDRTIGILKAALLMIEAALPLNSVDTSTEGLWSSLKAECWREAVKSSLGPASLMGCVVLLESVISAEFLYPHAHHLISCLPRHWKAIMEASTSAVALRIKTLDRGIKYGTSGGKSRRLR